MCVGEGGAVQSGSDNDIYVSRLDADTHLDHITGGFETEPVHVERANEENAEKDGSQFEKRKTWRSVLRRPVRGILFF